MQWRFPTYAKMIYLYLAISFSVTLLRFAALPFLLLFLLNTQRYTTTEVAFLLMLSPLVQLCVILFSANLIEHLSVRWATIAALLLPMCGYLLVVQVHSYHLLIFALVLAGIGWAIYNPLVMATLTKYATDEQLNDVMGLHYWVACIASALGPLLGVILGAGSSALPFYCFSLGLLILAVSVRIAVPATKSTSTDEKRRLQFFSDMRTILTDKAARYLFGAFFFTAFIGVQFESSFALHLKQLFGAAGVAQLAVFLTTMTLTTVCLQPLFIIWLKKVSTTRLLLLDSLLYACGIALFYWSNRSYAVIIVGIVLALAALLGTPRLLSLNARLGPPELKTSYFAFTTLAAQLAFFVGPVVGLSIYQYQTALLFYVLIGCALLYGLCAIKSQTELTRL